MKITAFQISERQPEAAELAALVRLADRLELAALDLLSGNDTFGGVCRRCGLGACTHLREALREYRLRREALTAEL
jgi:hypothetical protein